MWLFEVLLHLQDYIIHHPKGPVSPNPLWTHLLLKFIMMIMISLFFFVCHIQKLYIQELGWRSILPGDKCHKWPESPDSMKGAVWPGAEAWWAARVPVLVFSRRESWGVGVLFTAKYFFCPPKHLTERPQWEWKDDVGHNPVALIRGKTHKTWISWFWWSLSTQ